MNSVGDHFKTITNQIKQTWIKERMEKFSQREREKERREAYLRCILRNKGKVQKVVQRHNNGEKKDHTIRKERQSNKRTSWLPNAVFRIREKKL
jgi:2-oxoglutarate dehydrogenase complex dehydrogenase (E1) component-like enzyme